MELVPETIELILFLIVLGFSGLWLYLVALPYLFPRPWGKVICYAWDKTQEIKMERTFWLEIQLVNNRPLTDPEEILERIFDADEGKGALPFQVDVWKDGRRLKGLVTNQRGDGCILPIEALTFLGWDLHLDRHGVPSFNEQWGGKMIPWYEVHGWDTCQYYNTYSTICRKCDYEACPNKTEIPCHDYSRGCGDCEKFGSCVPF